MDDELSRLIFQAIDQTISSSDFERLQTRIEKDESARAEYLRAVRLCETLGEISAESTDDVKAEIFNLQSSTTQSASESRIRLPDWSVLAVAAAVLFVVSMTAFWVGQKNGTPSTAAQVDLRDEDSPESLIAGHASLRHAADLKWTEGTKTYREGDVLPDGLIQFDEGVAEIDFFCGATLIVEGPARLDVESDWSVQVLEGRLRANVPPAARGFIVKAAGSEIIDLGTEFALEVGADNARVEVIDGEVKLRGGKHDGNHLLTGQRRSLKGSPDQPLSFDGLSTVKDVMRRRADAVTERFRQWNGQVDKMSRDDRLIAYYPVSGNLGERVVANAASSGSGRNGHLVGEVHRTSGRFGAESTGLEFDRPGARVRTRIDGEFDKFTFSCWVKIDSLEHVYNALFMADGYENGEPHWQIRDDGRLMFSVMVDDSQKIQVKNRFDKRTVPDAGLHRVYFTDPIWDVSKSGQWFHLAAVYDPAERFVAQYVNGKQVSHQTIVDKFHVKTLRIGPAEIGNWGQPFRESPWFAVRNLNGVIDELAIFEDALSSEEIVTLYENGKPLGY